MDEPMSSVENPRRDLDEVSIASDFSIIPESFVGPEENLGVEGEAMASGGSLASLRSRDLHPSAATHTSYGKVVFQNLQATYTADTDIAVSYVLSSSVVAKPSDRIALYRVGFTSPQDYLGYQWAPTPSKDHIDNALPLTVIFKANILPEDAGEFFQFCYVTHEGHIVGVSTPMQLLAVGGPGGVCGVLEDGEEEVEGGESMVVVRTNESVLHDRINKLEKEKETLMAEVKQEKKRLDDKLSELEDKSQQLNMCQHHLQAVETKMKKETGEKCELMGRIGQVVEEKGHLEDRVRTLERSLALATSKCEALQSQYDQASKDVRRLEEELLVGRKEREQLDLSLVTCQEELNAVQQKLKDTETEVEKLRDERDGATRELEFWTSTAAADQSEKNSLALKFSTVNEELITKLEELDQMKREAKELEQKLADTVVEMTGAKKQAEEAEERVKVAEEERDTHQQRQEVVGQDNTQFKATIAQLKEKVDELTEAQKQESSGREAAETIASDLSLRLQSARTEYQFLAYANLRLAKKVKKLRSVLATNPSMTNVMSESVNSNVSSWLHAEVDTEEGIREATVEGAENTKVRRSSIDQDDMIQSFRGSEFAPSERRTVCSSCSDSTRQLSEVVHRKMEDIVKELSLQISSLKSQLHDQAAAQQQTPLPQDMDTKEQKESEETQPDGAEVAPKQEVPEHQEEARSQQNDSQSQVEEVTAVEEEKAAAADEESGVVGTGENERPVLYSNTFLPTAPTAPVFLPEPRQNQSVSAPPCSSPAPTHVSHDYAPSSTPTAPAASSQPLVSSHAPTTFQFRLPTTTAPTPFLPPPLMPETTPTALQAAVMCQFSNPPHLTNTESDDDDYLSTSDNDDTAPLNPTQQLHPQQQQPQPQEAQRGAQRQLLECPMCNLSFPLATQSLLQEHINSHLEYICPICSVAFQRNSLKKFEDHVQSHFDEEEGVPSEEWTNPLDDPSGPWGQHYRGARLLETD
ncbi:hypothetical protein Pcinc_008694 [Petrolisthes cinctipes]|uniref:C2H2-type domain-containing protein n=1 Tax=Petrolisthes cinctipes TaxID=88211 RepID=A0AAE1G8D8_PETCI|nr:hypothetical protein Pcinc_008694 [Petrolisthes cinctipes]